MILDIPDPTGLAKRINELNPNVIETLSRTRTEEYIYLMQESFSLPNNDFTVNFNVACKRVSSGFELSSSVITTDGATIAIVPSRRIDASLEIDSMRAEIDKWVRGVSGYIVDQAKLILERLEESR